METKNGGVRAGAGRKQKADKYTADINKAEKRIRDRLPEIVEAQIVLALGLKTTTEEGDVYTTIPDRAAGQYLINRIMGTPTQKQEVTGADGSSLKIVVEYADRKIDVADSA